MHKINNVITCKSKYRFIIINEKIKGEAKTIFFSIIAKRCLESIPTSFNDLIP